MIGVAFLAQWRGVEKVVLQMNMFLNEMVAGVFCKI